MQMESVFEIIITLTLRPRLSTDMWKALVAPVDWICLVWSEAVPIYQAGIVLLPKKRKKQKFKKNGR